MLYEVITVEKVITSFNMNILFISIIALAITVLSLFVLIIISKKIVANPIDKIKNVAIEIEKVV